MAVEPRSGPERTSAPTPTTRRRNSASAITSATASCGRMRAPSSSTLEGGCWSSGGAIALLPSPAASSRRSHLIAFDGRILISGGRCPLCSRLTHFLSLSLRPIPLRSRHVLGLPATLSSWIAAPVPASAGIAARLPPSSSLPGGPRGPARLARRYERPGGTCHHRQAPDLPVPGAPRLRLSPLPRLASAAVLAPRRRDFHSHIFPHTRAGMAIAVTASTVGRPFSHTRAGIARTGRGGPMSGSFFPHARGDSSVRAEPVWDRPRRKFPTPARTCVRYGLRWSGAGFGGGADGSRTHDLSIANAALSQLSYGPGEDAEVYSRRFQRASAVRLP